MPLGYMLEPQPTDRCRFIDISSPIVFDVNIAAAMVGQGISAWRLLVLANNNSGPSDTIRVTGAADLAHISTPTYDSSLLSMWPSPDCGDYARVHTRIWVPAGRSEGYLRITINSTGPREPTADKTYPSGFKPVTYLDIGNLIISDGYIVGDAAAQGGTHSGINDGLSEELRRVMAEAGPVFPRIRPKSARRSFPIQLYGDNCHREARSLLAKIRRWCGVSRPIFLSENVNGIGNQMQAMVYGLFDSINDVSNDLRTATLELIITEML